MNEFGLILLIVAGFYAAGCARPARGDAILFVSHAGRRFRAVPAERAAALPRRDGVWVFGHVLPVGESFLALPDAAFDPDGARREISLFRDATRGLRLLCAALFGYTFACAGAASLWRPGAAALAFFAGYVGLLVPTAVAAHRAHRRLAPADRGGRARLVLFLLLSPADAMHARGALGRGVLASAHPVAAAAALLDGPDLETFARLWLRALRHPMPGAPPAPPGGQEAALDFLRARGLHEERLLVAPVPDDPTCRAYCPRCERQYRISEGVCSDCARLPLEALRTDG